MESMEAILEREDHADPLDLADQTDDVPTDGEAELQEEPTNEIEKPKPTQKKPRTKAQKEAFAKAQQALALKRQQQKEAKAQQPKPRRGRPPHLAGRPRASARLYSAPPPPLPRRH